MWFYDSSSFACLLAGYSSLGTEHRFQEGARVMEQYKLPERKFSLCLRSLGMAKLWAVVLGVMLTTLVLAQTSAPAVDELTAARTLFQQGNFSGAAAAFQKI